MIWSVPKPTVKSTLCRREYLPVCRQRICVQSSKLVCMQLSKNTGLQFSCLCSWGKWNKYWWNNDCWKVTVILLPGLMDPCHSDFLLVTERDRDPSQSWPCLCLQYGLDVTHTADDQSLGNPRPLFVIGSTISSSHYTELHSSISDHYMNIHPGVICTIGLRLYKKKTNEKIEWDSVWSLNYFKEILFYLSPFPVVAEYWIVCVAPWLPYESTKQP